MADLGPAEGSGNGDPPSQIWLRASLEGEHRLHRTRSQFLATGLLGGLDVMLGVFAMTIVGGALLHVVGESVASIAGSLAFGLGLAIIAIGRSELFTENFLVPMIALLRGRGTRSQIARLWLYTFVGNVLGVAMIGVVLSGTGMLYSGGRAEFARQRLQEAIELTHLQTFAAALLAGMVMTLFTWLLHATGNDAARIVLGIAIGFLLISPPLMHVVVTGAELAIGAGAGPPLDVTDVATLLAVTLVGNIVGGIGFVTLGRTAQVLSWPAGR